MIAHPATRGVPPAPAVAARGLLLASLMSLVIAAAGCLDASSEPPSRSMAPPVDVALAPIVSGLIEPTFAIFHGEEILVSEKEGRILSVQNGSIMEEAALNIRDRVGSADWEQGLLGMALHPDFPDDPRVFLSYTDPQHLPSLRSPHEVTLVEYTANSTSPVRFDRDSEVPLLRIKNLAPVHNGGMLTFGPDGMLYFGVGDGHSFSRFGMTAQRLDLLPGSILRLDVDEPGTYTIPADNPFVGDDDRRGEIWASGLRNPWRFSFDPDTGDLWIGDVGWNDREEIDRVPAGQAGLNFGWPQMEGSLLRFPLVAQDDPFTAPVWDYAHGPHVVAGEPASDVPCAITGGHLYRGGASPAIPALVGAYLYADFCETDLYALIADDDGRWREARLAREIGWISSFAVDPEGELVLIDHFGGSLSRLVPSEASP